MSFLTCPLADEFPCFKYFKFWDVQAAVRTWCKDLEYKCIQLSQGTLPRMSNEGQKW